MAFNGLHFCGYLTQLESVYSWCATNTFDPKFDNSGWQSEQRKIGENLGKKQPLTKRAERKL